MIVVEGPDGAGKTTLIKQLAKHWGLPVASRVVGKDTRAKEDVAKWVEKNVSLGWQSMILDRHRLISEPIYGPILRGANQDPHFLDLDWLWLQLGRFYTTQSIVIYCLPPLTTVINNVLNDKSNDNSVVADHIVLIYSAYVAKAASDLSQRASMTSIYDYTGSSHQLAKIFTRWGGVIEQRKAW